MVKTSGKTILLSWGVKASGPSKVRPMARIQRCVVAGPLSMISKKWDGTCQGNHSMLVWEEGCLALIAWTQQLKGNINWHQAGQSSAERCFYLPTPVLYHVDWWLWPQMVHASSLFSLTTSNTRSIPANYSPSEYFFCSLFCSFAFQMLHGGKVLEKFFLICNLLVVPCVPQASKFGYMHLWLPLWCMCHMWWMSFMACKCNRHICRSLCHMTHT